MVRVQASCVQHPPSGEVLRAGGPTIGANSVSQHELFGWVSNPADTDGLLLSMRNKHPARPPRLTSAPPFAKKMMRAFFSGTWLVFFWEANYQNACAHSYATPTGQHYTDIDWRTGRESSGASARTSIDTDFKAAAARNK